MLCGPWVIDPRGWGRVTTTSHVFLPLSFCREARVDQISSHSRGLGLRSARTVLPSVPVVPGADVAAEYLVAAEDAAGHNRTSFQPARYTGGRPNRVVSGLIFGIRFGLFGSCSARLSPRWLHTDLRSES